MKNRRHCHFNLSLLHHIPNQATWFLKTISSHKYEERRIEVYDKKIIIWHFSYHMPYQCSTHISPRIDMTCDMKNAI
jgi:hypothetical protein